MGLDRLTESFARMTAARLTRRSFFARAGQVALVTAAGSAVTAVFSEQAAARVCGQTGVSPKCPTYDCLRPGFFGYCWYASPGCCANGGLKKICDCCLTGWPNVQGYCPTGAAVYCVVESCLEDPRVQSVPVDRWAGADASTASIERSKTSPGARSAVLVSSADPLAASIAVPVSRLLTAPILVVSNGTISVDVVAEINRLGVSKIVLCDPGLNTEVKRVFGDAMAVEQLAPSSAIGDAASASVEVARWMLARPGSPSDIVAIGTDGEAGSLAPAAAALAASRRTPLLVGVDAVNALRQQVATVSTVTAIGSSLKGKIAGSNEISRDSILATALDIADSTVARDSGSLSIGFVASNGGGFAWPVSTNDLVIIHEPGQLLDDLREWLSTRRRRFRRAELCLGAPGAFDNGTIYFLQSALNGYDAHQLAGHAGGGLPVYAQPIEEQEIGKARVSGDLPSTTGPAKPYPTYKPNDRWPVPTVVMPPPTSWPPGTTTSTLPPLSATTTRVPDPKVRKPTKP